MQTRALTQSSEEYPERLQQLHAPPDPLFVLGASLSELLRRPAVAIVGTRKMTLYGEQVTEKLAAELAEQGIVIISGLATGVDALAHRAALSVGGLAIAVLPSPVDDVVPIQNKQLAEEILKQGGALVSEYPSDEYPQKQYFIARNRIMSGLAQAVLITEAGEKSGALYTANFAKEQNRDVLVVPGNITQQGSVGANSLIKSGAALVTCTEDVLFVLGLVGHGPKALKVRGRNKHEQRVLDLMLEGLSSADDLLEHSNLAVPQFNQVITMLEISGKIRPLGANNWAIA